MLQVSFFQGSGMDTPLLAVRKIFSCLGLGNCVKYLLLGSNWFGVSIELGGLLQFLHLRSNSERNPVARRFLEKNFPPPAQLLICNGFCIVIWLWIMHCLLRSAKCIFRVKVNKVTEGNRKVGLTEIANEQSLHASVGGRLHYIQRDSRASLSATWMLEVASSRKGPRDRCTRLSATSRLHSQRYLVY